MLISCRADESSVSGNNSIRLIHHFRNSWIWNPRTEDHTTWKFYLKLDLRILDLDNIGFSRFEDPFINRILQNICEITLELISKKYERSISILSMRWNVRLFEQLFAVFEHAIIYESIVQFENFATSNSDHSRMMNRNVDIIQNPVWWRSSKDLEDLSNIQNLDGIVQA